MIPKPNACTIIVVLQPHSSVARGAGGSTTLHHNYVYFNDGLIKFVDRIDPLGNPIPSNNSHNSVNYAVQTFLQRNPVLYDV